MKICSLIKFIVLSYFSLNSYAKVFKLECIDNTNFVVQFDVDDVKQTVNSSAINATSVVISDSEISFYIYTKSNDVNWYHVISRYSGNMTVQNSKTKSIVGSDIRCKAVTSADRKF